MVKIADGLNSTDAIGRRDNFLVTLVDNPTDEQINDKDIENMQVKIYLNKKFAAEVAKLIDKSIYEPHKSLAKAIKQFAK
jgi:hypothetical protein